MFLILTDHGGSKEKEKQLCKTAVFRPSVFKSRESSKKSVIKSVSQSLKQVTTKNKHKPPQTTTTTTNYQQTSTNHQRRTTNHQQRTANHQQTTTNDQIDLFRIPIIQFFCTMEMGRSLTDVNKHRHLTSLCNLIYIPYATHDILFISFFDKSLP